MTTDPISVAPMMDWTDDQQIYRCINNLTLARRACLLYVSSSQNTPSLPAAKICFNGSSKLDAIYLYNDGCVPTHSTARMEAYLKRLAVLAKLKVG